MNSIENDKKPSSDSFAFLRDGTNLAYNLINPKRINDEVPLVMIMGFSETKESWLDLSTILSKNRTVLIYDNRGIGNSDVPSQKYTLEMLAQDLLDLLDFVFFTKDYNVKHVDLFGVSLGGNIAQMATLISPHKIRKLILGCSTPGGPSTKLGSGLVEVIKIFDNGSIDNIQIEKFYRFFFQHCVPESWINENKKIYDDLINRQLMYNRKIDGLKGQMEALKRINLEKKICTISQKVLIIHGDQDNIVPLESGKLLSYKIQRSEMFILKGAGHFFWLTHQKDVVHKIESFLNEMSKL